MEKYFLQRINASKRLRAFRKIANDLSQLCDSEKLESCLVTRAGKYLKSEDELETLWCNLDHSANLNLLIQIFYETGEHPIPDLETYSVRSHQIDLDSSFGAEARRAIDKAAEGVLKINDDTSLQHLAIMAKYLSDRGDYDEPFRQREGEIVAAALAKIGDDCEQVVNFAQNFSQATARNRLLLAFIDAYGVKNAYQASILSQGIEENKNFGCYLKTAIKEAAEKAGFEYDPDTEVKMRRFVEQLSRLFGLLVTASGPRCRNLSRLAMGRLAPSRNQPLPPGEKCASCSAQDTEARPFSGDEMMPPFDPTSSDLGFGGTPFDFMDDFFRRPKRGTLFGEEMRGGIPFPDFDIFDPLGLGVPMGREPLYLPDMPPAMLLGILSNLEPHKVKEGFFTLGEQRSLPDQLGQVTVDVVTGPGDIELVLGPDNKMSISDILASGAVCQLIGPEREQILRDYVSLFDSQPPLED
ncbi:MAG: hypothetical protein PHP25_04040 [Candidatus Moranbacteria bacterium]|nr:hypothetical protein [Candidatus Moranbacteria bacterium]